MYLCGVPPAVSPPAPDGQERPLGVQPYFPDGGGHVGHSLLEAHGVEVEPAVEKKDLYSSSCWLGNQDLGIAFPRCALLVSFAHFGLALVPHKNPMFRLVVKLSDERKRKK